MPKSNRLQRQAQPRRIRRGLIEASAQSCAMASLSASCPNPGEFAGASLKLQLSAPVGHNVWHHPQPRRIRRGLIEASINAQQLCPAGVLPQPRRIRRGLIEAHRLPRGAVAVTPPNPGEFFGASLKPGVPPIASLCGPHPNPGEFAGASLKPGCCARIPLRIRPPAQPRRIRRGLIEAIEPRVLLDTDAAGRLPNPGEFAGASLKLNSVWWRRRSLDGVPQPRRIRRGLIEASGVAPHLEHHADPNPGEFAGASLKLPLSARRFTAVPPPNPGEFAGASLKRVPADSGDCSRCGSPTPANSPGPH